MRRSLTAVLGGLAVLALAACGEPGSAGGGGGSTSDPAATDSDVQACAPIAGDQLVVLEDDQQLQTVDNVIPAINAEAAEPAMIAALDAVSASLDTDQLIELNQAVDIERNTSTQAAAEFYETAGIEITDTSGSGPVVVGVANFSESITLGELYALALTDAGYDPEVRTIGNRETYLPALQSGELTVVPEYVGTLTEFLNKSVNGPDATAENPMASADLDATVENLRSLGEEAGLVFGEPSDAADQNAYAVTQAFAEEHGVSTLSELAETCGDLVLGGPVECPDRPFCQPGLEETYGLDFAEFVSLDAGGPLTKQALTAGDIALGMVFSSDAVLATD
ncbi:glycine betaine ABC transporter substrate-binding protein [Georgenia subflava]|uniref:Glycine/betaine ABC transporter substrate-binding protein n=1 Tax=Georgenia subflava TaxID=1622177 RepID=A0A6N7EGV0_9MICO|nr:glycine betaine ABC transporter substrate-binding protein [Georgenia subflava]MPV36621.1 glycine/betaine ABC transporter substrate-binding protein [Georgenia subflava]